MVPGAHLGRADHHRPVPGRLKMGFRYLAWTTAALVYIGLSLSHGLKAATATAVLAAIIGFSAYSSDLVQREEAGQRAPATR